MATITTRVGTVPTKRLRRFSRGLRRSRRALLAFGVVVAGCTLVSHALRYLHAEVLWLTSTSAARDARWASARDGVQRALALHPYDYRYLERAAWLEQRLDRPRHAHALWRQALEERPGWPYAWAGLALWNLGSGGDGRELEYSLVQVARYGGNERGLRKTFAQQALEHWQDNLTKPARAALKSALVQELGQRRTHLMGYALTHRREEVLCGLLEREEGPQQWCTSARWMRTVCESDRTLDAKQRQGCQDAYALWQHLDYPAE